MKLRTTTISILAVSLLAGSAFAVAAQEDEVDLLAPSAFSALAEGQEEPEVSEDPDTGLTRIVVPSYEVEDPRASGRVVALDATGVVEADGALYRVSSGSLRHDNDDGSWVGTARSVFSVQEDGGAVGSFQELVGEGGYEGLTLFIFEVVGSDGEVASSAFIVPTDIVPAVPPAPQAD